MTIKFSPAKIALAPYINAWRQGKRTHHNLRQMQRQIARTIKALKAGHQSCLPPAIERQVLAIYNTRDRFEFLAHVLGQDEACIQRCIRDTTAAQTGWLLLFVASIAVMVPTTGLGWQGIPIIFGCASLAFACACHALIEATHRTVLRERDCITPRMLWSRSDLWAKWFLPWV